MAQTTKRKSGVGPLVATTPKGTEITQLNDSTYNWQNQGNYGQIRMNPNSGGPQGTYHVYQGAGNPPEERNLSPEALQEYTDFINTAEFEPRNAWYDKVKAGLQKLFTPSYKSRPVLGLPEVEYNMYERMSPEQRNKIYGPEVMNVGGAVNYLDYIK